MNTHIRTQSNSTLCESRLWIPILYWKLRFVYFKYHIISIVFNNKTIVLFHMNWCYILGTCTNFVFDGDMPNVGYEATNAIGKVVQELHGMLELATIHVFRRCDG